MKILIMDSWTCVARGSGTAYTATAYSLQPTLYTLQNLDGSLITRDGIVPYGDKSGRRFSLILNQG